MPRRVPDDRAAADRRARPPSRDSGGHLRRGRVGVERAGSETMVGAPPKQRRVTLAMVAASAGVSIATVSKVLNGRNDVASTTRAHVQEALQQHDYAASAPSIVSLPARSTPTRLRRRCP